MSREIKFRAWDDDVEHMFYSDKPEDDYWFSFEDGKLKGHALREPCGGADPMEPPEPYCDEYPVEEYTGLKDKNGVEGYKSDKVKFGSNRPIYQIKWSICNAGFYLESMDEQKENLHIGNLVAGEIFGNIHENPELINSDNKAGE